MDAVQFLMQTMYWLAERRIMRTSLSRPARIAGAATVTAALLFTMLPLAANGDPLPASVAVPVTVLVADNSSADTTTFPLAGARLSVRRADQPDTVIATAITAPDGRATAQLADYHDTSYIIHAAYPGFARYGEETLGRIEFNPAGEAPQPIIIEHRVGIVSGTVSGSIGGDETTDFSGSAISIASSGTEVQRLALAADGSFSSGALLTSELLGAPDEAAGGDYTLKFLPAEGYRLADEQPHFAPEFLLPVTAEGPSALEINPRLILVNTKAPEPQPQPEPSSPVNTPDFAGIAVNIGDTSAAANASDALDDMTSDQFDRLVHQSHTANGPVFITNGSHQVLGVALPLSPAMQLPIAALFQGRGVDDAQPTGVDNFAVLNLASALLAVQSGRNTLSSTELADLYSAVQQHNAEIATLTLTRSALKSFTAALPTEGCANPAECEALLAKRLLLQSALNDARLKAPFLDTFPDSRVTPSDVEAAKRASELLAAQVKEEIDRRGNIQNMDMLRLQSLTNRKEANHLMNTFIQKLREQSTTVTGNMRSEPVSVGSVFWDHGSVTGAFDLTRVPTGDHHLLLKLEELGVTLVSGVSVVKQDARQGMLPATGSTPNAVVPIFGIAFVMLAGIALTFARATARRKS